jgi:hypothetical protein
MKSAHPVKTLRSFRSRSTPASGAANGRFAPRAINPHGKLNAGLRRALLSVVDCPWRWRRTTLAIQTCQLRPPRTFPLVGPANSFLSLSRSAHIPSMCLSILSSIQAAEPILFHSVNEVGCGPRPQPRSEHEIVRRWGAVCSDTLFDVMDPDALGQSA